MPLVRRQKRTTLVGSLVLIVELGAQMLAALRLEATNMHIPFISEITLALNSDI